MVGMVTVDNNLVPRAFSLKNGRGDPSHFLRQKALGMRLSR